MSERQKGNDKIAVKRPSEFRANGDRVRIWAGLQVVLQGVNSGRVHMVEISKEAPDPMQRPTGSNQPTKQKNKDLILFHMEQYHESNRLDSLLTT